MKFLSNAPLIYDETIQNLTVWITKTTMQLSWMSAPENYRQQSNYICLDNYNDIFKSSFWIESEVPKMFGPVPIWFYINLQHQPYWIVCEKLTIHYNICTLCIYHMHAATNLNSRYTQNMQKQWACIVFVQLYSKHLTHHVHYFITIHSHKVKIQYKSIKTNLSEGLS